MKGIKLTNLDVARLHNAELSSLVARFFDDFSKTTLSLEEDSIFKKAFEAIKEQVVIYNTALDQVRTNEESYKIENAEIIRKSDFKALRNALKPFQNTTVAAELEAYKALHILFLEYKDVEKNNYEVKTTRITNLLERLESNAYKKYIDELGMRRFVSRLIVSNNAFKEVFSKRSFDILQRPQYDVKKLRRELTESYKKMTNYVLALAQMTEQTFYIEMLEVFNNGRKYFSDTILARRSRKKETKKPTNIA